MLDTALAVCAAAWGLVIALSPLLQIRRMARQRSSRDVSIGYWWVLLVGFALWVAYGVAAANLALIVPNAVAFGVGCLTIAVAVRYRPPRARSPLRPLNRAKAACRSTHSRMTDRAGDGSDRY